jgi:drug/metabolite transporter (DMT)-like permease
MALGSIGVVATIGALGIVVPIAVGLARGEEPSALQAAGAAIAIGAILLVAREPDPEWRRASRRAVGLAALAALGFGTFFVTLDLAAATDPVWTIVAARVGGVAALLALAAYVRPSVPRDRATLRWLVAIGFFDVLANGLFAVATTHGLLSLVAVVGSLYSAVTILLARVVLGERLSRVRTLGVVLALAGVALIAAGG